MRSEIDKHHERLMEYERQKDELSWMLIAEQDESKIEIISIYLDNVLRNGMTALAKIDEIAKEN